MRQSRAVQESGAFIDRKPFIAFFICLGLLLLLIIVSNMLANASKKDLPKTSNIKDVSVYRTAESPSVTLQGQVEKSGVYAISAQTPGIVQSVNFHEGDSVTPGQSIVTLSSNYQGDNAPALQAGLAQRQYQNILSTYDTQKTLIHDERDVATASAQNTTQLNKISDQARSDTNGLITLNQSILDTITAQITTLQNNGANDATTQAQILALKGQQAQLQGGINQLNSTSRSLDYQINSNNPPTLLSNLQKDIALKQLDVQAKALDLGRDVARIQANLAAISESLMNPSSPGKGIVDRIFVHTGESVQPGTALASIVGDKQASTVVVRVPETLARQISRADASTLHIGTSTVQLVPSYVSQEATDGQLYTLIYTLTPQQVGLVTNGSYLSVDIPLTATPVTVTPNNDPYIPLDAIYQTQNESYVYVISKGRAETRSVTLGDVYGKFVAVTTGVGAHDQIILNRNIVVGDSVHATN